MKELKKKQILNPKYMNLTFLICGIFIFLLSVSALISSPVSILNSYSDNFSSDTSFVPEDETYETKTDWDFYENLIDVVFPLEPMECQEELTVINLSKEAPDDFWDIETLSDILITNTETEEYYNFNITNYTVENRTGYLHINTCLSDNYKIIYGVPLWIKYL